MKTSELLRRAKKYISAPNTWCHGRYFIEGDVRYGIENRYCLVGAINMAATGDPTNHNHVGGPKARALCLDEFGVGLMVLNDRANAPGVGQWAPGGGQHEVITNLNKLIALAAARGD